MIGCLFIPYSFVISFRHLAVGGPVFLPLGLFYKCKGSARREQSQTGLNYAERSDSLPFWEGPGVGPTLAVASQLQAQSYEERIKEKKKESCANFLSSYSVDYQAVICSKIFLAFFYHLLHGILQLPVGRHYAQRSLHRVVLVVLQPLGHARGVRRRQEDVVLLKHQLHAVGH